MNDALNEAAFAATGQRVSTTPLPDWFSDGVRDEANALRCTRGADRAKMVKLLTRLSQHYGASIEAHTSALNHLGITVHIHLNGAYVMILLDGTSSLHKGKHRSDGGTFLGHWNIDRGCGKRYSRYFGTLAGSVNEHHWQKATTAVQSFGNFVLYLAIALGSVQDGTAFQ